MIVKRLKFKKILVIGLIGLLPVTGAFAQDTITVSLPKALEIALSESMSPVSSDQFSILQGMGVGTSLSFGT